jgi:hypothetical protein
MEEKTTEQRMEELGLEGFFSDFLYLERRVDDLEAVLAKALTEMAAAENREERMEALKVVDELPTMRAHRAPL